MRAFVLSVALFAVPLVGHAEPTWPDMKAATWSTAGKASHKEVGDFELKKATVKDLECWGAEAKVGVSMDKILEVVQDVEAAKDWSTAGVTVAEKLGSSGTKVYYYQYLDVPGWTMSSDRFWFLEGDTTRSGDEVIFQWKKLADGGDYGTRYQAVKKENPSAVEPPINVGAWWLSKADGQTRIRYYICTDTGGSIPGFVQSAATKQTLPDTVGDVVREAKKRGG